MTYFVERLVELRRHLDHLRDLRPRVTSAETLRRDLSLHNDVLFSLLMTCQLVIDIAGEGSVQTLARDRGVRGRHAAPPPGERDLVRGPAPHDEPLDERARCLGHVALMEAPRMIAAEPRFAFDERQARLGTALDERQRDERVLQPAADEHVVLVMRGRHHANRMLQADRRSSAPVERCRSQDGGAGEPPDVAMPRS